MPPTGIFLEGGKNLENAEETYTDMRRNWSCEVAMRAATTPCHPKDETMMAKGYGQGYFYELICIQLYSFDM